MENRPVTTRSFKIESINLSSLDVLATAIEQQKRVDLQDDSGCVFSYLVNFKLTDPQLNRVVDVDAQFVTRFFESFPSNLRFQVGFVSQGRALTLRSYYLDFIIRQMIESLKQLH